MKAIANEGYEFVNWSVVSGDPLLVGKAVSTDPTYTFELTGDMKLQANFVQTNEPSPTEEDRYYCAEGSGGIWTKASNDELVFVFKRSADDDQTFDRFTGIEVDGVAVDKGPDNALNYTVASGSAIVVLQPSYLNTLSVGQHTVKAVFEDGEAQALFTVKAAPSGSGSEEGGSAATTKPAPSGSAKTGDSLAAAPVIVLALLVMSALCLVFARRSRRER